MDASDWDARYAAAAELMWSAAPNRWVAEELAGLPPGRALDLAAGEGRNSIWLAGLGWSVTAVDFSEVALAKGRRLAASADVDGADIDGPAARISWQASDLLSFEPEPAGFDLVLLCYLQLAAEQRSLVIRRAASALAPGGSLLVIAHDSRNLAEGVGGPQDPAVLYGPVEIVADLSFAKVGVLVEKAVSVSRPVPGADRPAIDALVRAVRPR
ncbi:MAG: class I SAM-dependent methyltransferase [Jatrophihabitantaceae bacterium]